MKYLFSALFSLCAATVLSSETVMVYVRDSADSGYIIEERLEEASAVETGAMDFFFEEGHIVFNAGIRLDEADIADELMVRVARSGGASYLLYIGIGPADEDTQIPEYLDYEYIHTVDQNLLSKGRLTYGALELEKPKAPVDTCTLFGQRVVALVTTDWANAKW